MVAAAGWITRLPMRAIRIGLRTGAATDSGRWVEADLDLPGGGVTIHQA